jgi:hypothetical protein
MSEREKKPAESLGTVKSLAAKPWAKWVLVIFMAILYFAWGISVLIRDKQADFNLYYMAAYGFAHGKDIYGADPALWAELARDTGIRNYAPPYRYPPLTALLVWPLTSLPPVPAAAVWLLLSAAACMASAMLLGSILGSPYGSALSLALCLGYVPVLTTMNVGQVNALVLLSLSASLRGLMKNPLDAGRRRSLAPGIGAAAGSMLKLVPLAHLLYLGWTRKWRDLALGFITLIVLLALALPLVGRDGLRSYAAHFFSLGESGTLVPVGANQSFNGFFSRTLAGVLDPGSIRSIILASACLFVIATIALCWPSGERKRMIPLEFALITIAVNLITPYAWYHQLILLLIPILVLAGRALEDPKKAWILLPLAACYAALDVHGLFWHSFEGKPFLVSTPLYAALTIWGILASIIVREKKDWRRAGDEGGGRR